jgi:hypothetical protein
MSNMGHGCFHAKLMILIYDEWIRVVISSANLISHDWEISENIVFVQDFPRYNENNTTNNDLHLFAKELKDYLLAMGLKSHIIDKLPQYDFSKAKVKFDNFYISYLYLIFISLKEFNFTFRQLLYLPYLELIKVLIM